MTLSVAAAIRAVEALSGVDFPAALVALKAGDIVGDLQTVDQVASVVAKFVPQAEYVADAAELLIIIVKAREAGLWAPADDPAALNRHNQPTSAG